ncbi:MAG: FHA domain-containing protein [Deltaproteobacteria bacterium]|nr:FHA domain-containing protein [Deltaproteobacteria bacterium]
MAHLEIHNTKEDSQSLVEINKEHFVIGRTEDCNLQLEEKAISRRHAEINLEDGDYFLTDLRSGNGTKLGGKRIRALEKQLLKNGDIIEIEYFRLRFIGESSPEEQKFEEDTDTDILEIKLIKKMMEALDEGEEPSLEVLSGSGAGLKFTFKEGQESATLGRSEEADFCIPDNVLSRLHAKVERKWGGIVLSDLDSKNGCFVNGENIKEKLLRDGDRILLGTIKLLYRDPGEVKAHIAHQEISRKKKEAALQEAEALARKQLEAEKQKAQEEARQQAQAEEEAKALEESLAEDAKKAEEQKETNKKQSSSLPSKTSQSAPTQDQEPHLEKEPLSSAEKLTIVLGILVAIGAVVAVVSLLT